MTLLFVARRALALVAVLGVTACGSAGPTPSASSWTPAPMQPTATVDRTPALPSGTPGPTPIGQEAWLEHRNREPAYSVSFPQHWLVVTPDAARRPEALRALAARHPALRDRIPSLAEEIRDEPTRVLLGLEDIRRAGMASDVVAVVSEKALAEAGGFDGYIEILIADLELMNEPFILRRLPHVEGEMVLIRTESEEGTTDAFLIPNGDDLYSFAFSRRGGASPDWEPIARSFAPASPLPRG